MALASFINNEQVLPIKNSNDKDNNNNNNNNNNNSNNYDKFFLKIVMIFIHNSVRIFTDVYRTKTNSALRTKMNTNSGELA